MSKNILILFSHFIPRIGGAERQLERVAYGLIKNGYTVDVITRKYEKRLQNRENINGINVIRIPILKLNQLSKKLTFTIFTLIFLMIKGRKYDVIIASQLGSCSYIASIYKRFSRTPFISRVAGSEAELLSKSESGRKKFKKVASNVDYIVSINNRINGDLGKFNFPERRILNITNGVKLSKPVNILDNTSIIYCGRIKEIKGIDILLESMRILESFNHDIQLVIVGEGSDKQYFQKKYSDLKNIEWVGKVSNPDLYYRKSRLLVLPSRYEGVSNTLLEAMACGLPVIATKVGGNPEVINDEIDGVLIDKEDPEKLADAIISLYYDSDKLNKFQINGLKKIKESYLLDKAVGKYIKAITSICS
ncbi:glycosyltransferase family 4 protein [Wukongibacter baidiensis]|uniref:glycosyltransferase family 4 protein n=1 Tax=Wukongibacter baidiensis TaxID=1723361 RepID=UPI003D7F7105